MKISADREWQRMFAIMIATFVFAVAMAVVAVVVHNTATPPPLMWW